MTKKQAKPKPKKLSQSDLEDLVIESDTGARKPTSKFEAGVLLFAALLWSLFQLWIASPLQFSLGIFVLNDTQTRAIHLGFAVFLSFLAYPALSRSPREYIPKLDWLAALVGAFTSSYLYLFYDELATRSGLPTQMDIATAAIGMLLLLEATRRALGPPLLIIASIFLIYTFFGSAEFIPEVLRHKGQSFSKVASHMWLTTEGVFGIALGVSTSFVFLFVLFGALLDKAGAGNYFIKVAFSLLGHLRGGPAKAAVLSSGMTGLISGSSIANTVTTGTFTIPLMRRVGFSGEKAGAVEVSSSVNGQIMPPVMGAAAFLMVEYVGIPYIEVIKHAFLPALISYIALLYIVHLEAVKANMEALPKPVKRTGFQTLISFGIVATSIILLSGIAYVSIAWIKDVFGDSGSYVIALAVFAAYITLIWFASKHPDLEPDDPNSKAVKLPETGPTVKTGLHYLLPIVVLVWCLMVERFSPGLSAFWATVLMIFILSTQRVLKAFFRKQGEFSRAFKHGIFDLLDGLVAGARNMIGIGVATAAAGIIVGTVSLTGVGQVLTEVVELIAGDSVILILMLTAVICLILGMGLPTTANYIVVASLMANVVVQLGAQNGLVVPLIAVHLFVFYFGIMADVTPPVGLASFAAAAISGSDPIRTGLQAFAYSIRTAILPFFFIFNTELIMIGVESIWHGLFVFVKATIAILLFSAAAQGYFLTRNKIIETVLLLMVALTLFVPKMWIDIAIPKYHQEEVPELRSLVESLPEGTLVKIKTRGEDRYGELDDFQAFVPLAAGATMEEKFSDFGILLREEKRRFYVEDVVFNSPAEKAGIDFDHEITMFATPQEQPNPRIMYIPAIVLFLIVVGSQSIRRKRARALEGLGGLERVQ